MNSNTLLLLSRSSQLYIIVPEAVNAAIVIIVIAIVWLLAVILIINVDISMTIFSFLVIFYAFLQHGMHFGQFFIALNHLSVSVMHLC